MPDNVQSEKDILSGLRKSINYDFENDITDENIRKFIFGKDGYTEKAIRETNKYPQYFNNIILLVFYFVYACYRCSMNNGYVSFEDLKKHNSKRINKSLESAFVEYPVTLELVQFVLTDIQFELAQGEKSELKSMFSNLCDTDATDFSFNPYFKIIAEYNQGGASRFQHSKIELTQLFSDLIKNLSFLSEYKLEKYGPDEFCFITKKYMKKKLAGIPKSANEKYDELDMAHLLFLDEKKYLGGVYRLFCIETEERIIDGEKISGISLRYITPRGDRSLSFDLPQENSETASHLEGLYPDEVYQDIVGDELVLDKEINVKKNANSINQVHTVNYKYIKNLALAISDAISSESSVREYIYNRFSKIYPYVFGKIPQGTEVSDFLINLDWDSVIIMLLIEASPTVLLEGIFRRSKGLFYSIGYNLHKRSYDADVFSIFTKGEDVINVEVRKIIDEKFVLGEAGGFGKLKTEKTYGKLFSKAATMFILAKLTDVQQKDSDDNLIYTGNLQNNIGLLKNTATDTDCERKIKYSCIILGETLKHIMCFYAGLFEYGKIKKTFDLMNVTQTLSEKAIKDCQKKLKKAFLSAASEQVDKLSAELTADPESALATIDTFIAFAEKCDISNGGQMSESSKNLYAAVGKYEFLNIRRFKKIIQPLKTFNGEMDETSAAIWVETVVSVLEYLKTGSLSDTPMNSDLFNAIYPFTAVFNRGKENTDGYKTVTFSLNIDVEEDSITDFSMDVNVLSEFVYDRSEVYYCLPHVIRSNYKWWIDPVLISFKEFDDIFFERGKEKD